MVGSSVFGFGHPIYQQLAFASLPYASFISIWLVTLVLPTISLFNWLRVSLSQQLHNLLACCLLALITLITSSESVAAGENSILFLLFEMVKRLCLHLPYQVL